MPEYEEPLEKTNEPTAGLICDACGQVVEDSATIVVQPGEDPLCVNCRASSE